MGIEDEIRQVDKRLAVYSPDTQLNNYINAASDVNGLCYSILNGKLSDEDDLTKEKLNKLKREIRLKLIEAQLYIDSEKIKTKIEDEASQENIDQIKRQMKDNLPLIQKLNDEIRRRNHMLKSMNAHISMANDILADMFNGNSELSATKEKWENILGATAFAKLSSSGVFKSRISFKEGVDGDKKEIEELVVYSNFSKDTSALKKTNELVKGDIKRLTEELASYKAKWSHNAEVFDKISEILKVEMAERNILKPEEPEDKDEEEGRDSGKYTPHDSGPELDELEEDVDEAAESDEKILDDFGSPVRDGPDDQENEDVDMEGEHSNVTNLAEKAEGIPDDAARSLGMKSSSMSPETPDIE
ncbi:LAFE_0A02124g1_1 [Lachancea fermentati]|uniref:LAFE_0A02124g1_1 n=1 Tax=Lachancea fermentati TaxID=4955 RepID=A0A1G4M6F4_LACFM|nr:LAFE_0A02124g1_1 [Lachancea fermentati]